jgi:uncharacterized C2H2 Zn-finger protein
MEAVASETPVQPHTTEVAGFARVFIVSAETPSLLRPDPLPLQRQSSKPAPLSGKSSFCCPHCPKYFSRAASLRQHEALHTEEKRLKCTRCEMTFAWKTSLRKHVVEQHRVEQMKICNVCQGKFANKHLLQVRTRHHTMSRFDNEVEPLSGTRSPRPRRRAAPFLFHLRQVLLQGT